jgi:NAD(P)-dependent dehydrogenase (short-subunit alcohol dehydrogenase family)
MNMVDVFGATSTTDEVLSGVDLQGKRILVTGVSAGLRVETARSLAAHGAHVVGAARDLAKAEQATVQVKMDAAAHGGSFEVVALDLANLSSVRDCADKLLKKGEPFDVVIANAGVMATPFSYTTDRFEMQFGTNHLGHFVLVNRIASLIRSGGRLINLSSSGHRYGPQQIPGHAQRGRSRARASASRAPRRERPDGHVLEQARPAPVVM